MKSLLIALSIFSLNSLAQGACQDQLLKARMNMVDATKMINSVKELSGKITEVTCAKVDQQALRELSIAVESYDYLAKKAKQSVWNAEELYADQYCDYGDSFDIELTRKRVANLEASAKTDLEKAKKQLSCL